ncbi:putative lin-9 [Fasciola gigantica]|uniref:Putative lin-9 n=1 Tax=Fasciola gigantica TaxID=46835 RepID=A0A504YF68_FASGI|nr:putative lin-9 [Fasciola gigantica]
MNDQMYSEFDYVPYVNTDNGRPGVNADQQQQIQQSNPVFLPFSSEPSSTSNRNSQYVKAQTIQKRFCHMLTTQKFCEWLRHEWLYSSVDREIFLGPNDFQLILREHFPNLKTRRMCRGHWAIVRRIIGRPRRFSPTFLSEERGSVQGKRRNLHYLQHLTTSGSLGPMASEHLSSLLTCLPATARVPPRFPIGTKVCLSLYTPLQGLYLGVIEDSCPGDGHYTVWVDELVLSNGLTNPSNPNTHQTINSFRGFHIVPDEDVFALPNQSLPSHIPISALRYHLKENLANGTSSQITVDYRLNNAYRSARLVDTTNTRSDDENPAMSTSGGPLLSETVCTVDCALEGGGSADLNMEGLLISTMKPDTSSSIPDCSADSTSHFQAFTPQNSPKLFSSLAKLFKLLKEKRSSVDTLKEMNNTAETKLTENPNSITVQFQHAYAMLILHLDKLNQEMKSHMDVVLMHVASRSTPVPYLVSTHMGEVFEAIPVTGASPEFGYVTVVPGSLVNHVPNGVLSISSGYGLPGSSVDCAHVRDDPTESVPNDYRQAPIHPSSYDDHPGVADFRQLAQEQNMMHLSYITEWRRRCEDEAQEMVSRIKQSQVR